MASSTQKHSAIIFPFLAQGHILPFLDLSKALALQDLHVTIISTPANAQRITPVVSQYANIMIHVIPFPDQVDSIPGGCESTDHLTSKDQFLPFLRATLELKHPFERYLQGLIDAGNVPICLITDMFLGWALGVCHSLSIPGLIFHAMGVLPAVIGRMGFLHTEMIKSALDSETFSLPGLEAPFSLARSDFPELLINNNPIIEFLIEIGDAECRCSGLVLNSFEELDGDYVGLLESTYEGDGIKVWCVGPLLLYDSVVQESKDEFPMSHCKQKPLTQSPAQQNHVVRETQDEIPSYIDRLNLFDEPGSVIYISFGTQAYITDARLDEIASGLEMAGHPFLWAVKSETWKPASGWEERIKGKGLVVKEWVEQRRVLAHPAIGGFFSHCGWNSTLESLNAGVPLLAWPIGAEQPLNAKLVVELLAAGVSIKVGKGHRGIVSSHDIRDGIKELMGEKRGELAEKAREFSRKARRAVQEGGSSSRNLDRLIKSLTDSAMKS